MRKMLNVAIREYVETVKTKAFIISLLLTPAISIGLIYFSGKMATKPAGARPPLNIAVTDLTGRLDSQIQAQVEKHNQSNPGKKILFRSIPAPDTTEKAIQAGKTMLRSGQVGVYILINKDIFEKSGKIQFFTYQPKAADMDSFWSIERLLDDVVVEERCKIHNISRQLITDIRNVTVQRLELESDSDKAKIQQEKDSITKMMVPFFFMFMIYVGIVGYSQHMLSSIIEEKNSRIIEVLLSSITPFELMAGKVLGLAGVAFTVMGLWTAAAHGSAVWQGLSLNLGMGMLLLVAIYYILGFFFFSSILAGLGSTCNTLKETQTLMMPIVLMFMVPIMSWLPLVQDPNGLYAKTLSFIPPLTPLVMVLRIAAGKVSAWEIVVSIALLAISVWAIVWFSARIFRTGILMYGKRPSLIEIIRWFRQS